MTNADRIATPAAAGSATGALITAGAALALAVNNVTVPLVYAAGANAPTVVLLRYLFLLAVLTALLMLMGRSLRLRRAEYLHAAGAGIAAAIGAMSLLGSFARIPLGLAILIAYLYPIFTALMQSLIERRLPSLWQLSCLLAAFLGLGIALEIRDMALNPTGVGLAFMAALGFGASFVWNRYGLPEADSTIASLHMGVAGTLVTGLVLILLAPFRPPAAGDLTGWLLVGAVSICFSLAFLGMFAGVQRIGATAAAMIMNLEPILTIALAVLMLGEALTLARLIGGAIVLAAVLASQMVGHTPGDRPIRQRA